MTFEWPPSCLIVQNATTLEWVWTYSRRTCLTRLKSIESCPSGRIIKMRAWWPWVGSNWTFRLRRLTWLTSDHSLDANMQHLWHAGSCARNASLSLSLCQPWCLGSGFSNGQSTTSNVQWVALEWMSQWLMRPWVTVMQCATVDLAWVTATPGAPPQKHHGLPGCGPWSHLRHTVYTLYYTVLLCITQSLLLDHINVGCEDFDCHHRSIMHWLPACESRIWCMYTSFACG